MLACNGLIVLARRVIETLTTEERMDRYDWDWDRGYAGWGGPSYDRSPRYGGEWEGRRYRPGRGYRGRFAEGGPDWRSEGGGFHGGPGPGRGWERGYDNRYRFSYSGPSPGGRGHFGRWEPWEPGPPGGYGSQWGSVYGDRPARDPRYGWGSEAEQYHGRATGYRDTTSGFDRYRPGRGYADPSDFMFDYDEYDPALDEEMGEDRPSATVGWAGEPDDAEVREMVTRSLSDDGFIDAEAIQIEVKDRVVTLRGEVKDYLEARYAWDDAWDAPGVRGVISKLTVQDGKTQEAPPGATRKASSGGKTKRSGGGGKRKS